MSTASSDLLAGVAEPRVYKKSCERGVRKEYCRSTPFICEFPGQCERLSRERVCRQCQNAIKAEKDATRAHERALLAEKVRQRKMLRSMTPKERAKLLHAQQTALAARVDANNTIITGRGPASLLSLPPEIREKIYDALWEDSPPCPLNSARPCYGPRDFRLHQVCVLLKSEVKLYFFLRTRFRFHTRLALDSWGRNHTLRLSLMRNIEMSFPDASPIVQFAANLQNLRSLLIQSPSGRGISYGEVKVVADSLCWVIAWRQLELIHDALPQFRNSVIEHSDLEKMNGSRQIRFRLDEPQVSKHDRLASWSAIDMKVVGQNIDWLVPRMAGRMPFASYEMDGIRYNSCRDFVRRGLGRDPTPWCFHGVPFIQNRRSRS